jgi:GTP:adenosylcobinamide-phosphate guanylyltransferase
MTKMVYTVILLAGQRPGVDPLAEHFDEPFKALIEIAGQPMLAWVASVLVPRADVGRVVIVAQNADALLDHPATRWLRDEAKVATREAAGSIAETIATTIDAMPRGYPFLVTTADNVLLTDAILDCFLVGAAGSDMAVGLVERRTLEAAYPGNRRTWLPFRGGAYSGTNLFWLGSAKALSLLAVWRHVEQQRKKARAILGAFGPGLALLIALRILTLGQAITRVGKRFGLKATAVLLPQAEACIDVDKVSDHAMAEGILRGR